MRWFIWVLGALALGGCVTGPRPGASVTEVQILALNDFHGNLEPPNLSVAVPVDDGVRQVAAGGAANLGGAVAALRTARDRSIVVAAGDLIGASPLSSALFLDEPTIQVLDAIGLELSSVGNHEFDRGSAELLRLQYGGCAKLTSREPCALEPFRGARFRYLAANVLTENGDSLFAGAVTRKFGRGRGRVRIGFIGMTLKGTPEAATPDGVRGLRFTDEAETANMLIPGLKAEGADAIVLLLHQGGEITVSFNDHSCAGLKGAVLAILNRLSPEVDVVVSGHTHKAYVCEVARGEGARPLLLTSAGSYGMLLTDIRLGIDPGAGRVVSARADNRIVRALPPPAAGPGNAGADAEPAITPDSKVAAIVARYAKAAAPLAGRTVGRLSAPARRERTASGESVLGDLIADAQLAATRAPGRGGAEIALMNEGGVRADLQPGPDGAVTYGQLFAVQPFGNSLVVKTFTGAQIRAVLERQFDRDTPKLLLPSAGLRYSYDPARPAGARVLDVSVSGALLDERRTYRVTINSFLASGGDGFAVLALGTDTAGGGQDLDALEAYFAAAGTVALPVPERIRKIGDP